MGERGRAKSNNESENASTRDEVRGQEKLSEPQQDSRRQGVTFYLVFLVCTGVYIY